MKAAPNTDGIINPEFSGLDELRTAALRPSSGQARFSGWLVRLFAYLIEAIVI